jgi:hypothetical protein
MRFLRKLTRCTGGNHAQFFCVAAAILFARFIQDRKSLEKVSDRTIEWREQSLRWLSVRAAGLKSISADCRIGSISAYLHWLNSPLRVPKLKQESYVPPRIQEGWRSPEIQCRRTLCSRGLRRISFGSSFDLPYNASPRFA